MVYKETVEQGPDWISSTCHTRDQIPLQGQEGDVEALPALHFLPFMSHPSPEHTLNSPSCDKTSTELTSQLHCLKAGQENVLPLTG